jgi:ABC-2 type transport system permease protein
MLTRIIQHELRNLSRDRTLWIITGLLAAIVGYGVFNGASWVRFQKETIRQVTTDEARKFAAIENDIVKFDNGSAQPAPNADPRDPAFAGRNIGQRYAIMPPAPLAALSIGQSDLYPYYFRITTRSKQAFINADEIENPNNLLAGRFDLAFVIVYLYPLLILVLSYNLLSAEKEGGQLAMVGAQPVSLRTIVLGKIALRAGVILALSIGFSLIGILLANADFTSGEGGEVALRLCLWVAVVTAYGAFWFAVAVAINALGKSSATNAVVLSGVWLLLVLIVPSLVNLAATTFYPVPSRVELINAIRDASNEAAAEGSNLLSKYYEDHPELIAEAKNQDPTGFAFRFYATQEKVDRSIEPVLRRFDEQLTRQQTLVERARFLSPAIVTQEALNDIAGTSGWRYRHFLEQVNGFHESWKSFFVPKVFRQVKLTLADYARMPKFVWQEEELNRVTNRVFVGLIGLLVPAMLVGALGLFAVRRYPVTS